MKAWRYQHSLATSLANMTGDKALEALARMKPMNDELMDLFHMREDAQDQNVVRLEGFAKKET